MSTMQLEKITSKPSERTRRSYGDACAAVHALDLVGDRWALPVVRELMFGARRFSDIREALPGISANVLTQRLEELETAGVVLRRKLPPPASVQVYDLTDWGRELEPVFQVLGKWGARSPVHDPSLPISANSVLLSFRTMFDASLAGDWRATVALVFGDERFLVTIADGAIRVERSEAAADAVVTAPPATLAAAVYGGRPLSTLQAEGALRIDGDDEVVRRFTTLFPLPEKVPSRTA